MQNALLQMSGIIVAGTQTENQQILDGIRNLSNMSLISYPKERLLQIILDPRIILQETPVFSQKCADLKFSSIRNKIIDVLSKFIDAIDVIMMLKSFTNKLVDNEETFHVHGINEICESTDVFKNQQNNLIRSLYEKCQAVGLPYGYLNLYSSSVLRKITKSKNGLGNAIIQHVECADEFKEILQLCCSDYRKAVSILRIIKALSKYEKPSFHYLISLPTPVIELLLQGIHFHNKCCKISRERIDEILNIYRDQYDLFLTLKKQPFLSKLLMTHSNTNIMNAFLDVISYNQQQITSIHTINANLAAFLFSHLSGHAETQDAMAIIELAKTDFTRCNSIITNAPLIKDFKIKNLCELAIHNPAVFDLLFDKQQNLHVLIENHDIIEFIKKITSKTYQEVKQILSQMKNDMNFQNE